MRFFFFLLLLGGLLVLSSPVPALQEPPPLDQTPVYWEGSLTRRGHVGAGRELAFGFSRGAHELIESTLKVRFREAWDGPEGITYLQPWLSLEQGIWNSKVSDLYYENDDKKRFNAGDGGAGGGAIPDYSFQAEVFYLVDPKTNAPMVNFIFWVNDDHGSKSAFSFPVDRIPLGHGLGRDGAGGLTTLVLKPERRTKLDFHPFAGASFNQRGSMGGKVTLRQYKGSENEEETWIFIRSGGVEDLELEVEAVGYDNWIPKGGKDETSAGNQITISAKLKTKDGKPLREKAKIIKFELSQVSQEPGVCLNWPPKASAPGHVKDLKDLQFDDKKNSKLEIKGPRKQTAETPDGEYAEAEAVISCYDYGAWGTIKVVAEMANGTPVVGYLKGHPNQKEILLPKRKATSKIADAWKALPENDAVALADDDDNENSPEGDKHRGDGLTLYEEYRGFLVNGKHVCGNPHLKDVFIQNVLTDGRTMQGIKLFKDVSGLEVHSGLTKDELGEDRIINCNHQTAHRVDQHGIVLTNEGEIPFWAAGEAVGGPGTPGEIKKIVIKQSAPGIFGARLEKRFYEHVVAHELLHSVNVAHHGNNDVRSRLWNKEKDNKGKTILNEQGQPVIFEWELDDKGEPTGTGWPIKVYYEDQEEVSPLNWSSKGVKVWIARQGGQHSGQENCLMRYESSAAYEKASATVRWMARSSEPPGAGVICEAKLGTGINASDRSPWPCYGDATNGNCKSQIRVNDH